MTLSPVEGHLGCSPVEDAGCLELLLMRHPLPMPGGPHSGLWEKGTIMPHLREGKGGCQERITYQGQSWDSAHDYLTSHPGGLPCSRSGRSQPLSQFPHLVWHVCFLPALPSKIHEIVQYLSVLLAWLHPLHSLHQPGWEWHWCSRLVTVFLHTSVSALWGSGQGIRGGDQCSSCRRSVVFHYCKLRVGPWASYYTSMPWFSFVCNDVV